MTIEPEFAPGQVVCLRADRSRQGSVLEVLPPVEGQHRYRVFHSASMIREYDGEQLIAVDGPSVASAISDALQSGDWLDIQQFRASLTAARLSHPQTDNLYALHAARIQYVPFQLKPLLRFLRADRPRLLIADEVGVGKTIEAGLILKEMETRQHVENVLVLCPKTLVRKWRAEMERFDERFMPLSSENLRYCLHEAHLDAAWPAQYARSIVHFELLRREDYLVGARGRHPRPGLFDLDPRPRFTLVIVDEAHHLRNTETNTHALGRFLCDTADAVLFLSATPVHTSSDNLFTLLNLLRPDLFPDNAVFSEVVAPNRHLIDAMRNVRTMQPKGSWQAKAADSLATAGTCGHGTVAQDPFYTEWLAKLEADEPLAGEQRVRCLRDVEEMHTLAHIVNRTRRRDIGRFTTREPHTIAVPFTPAQEEFYNRFVALRHELFSMKHDPFVVRLIIVNAERQASSCLPALIPLLDGFLKTGQFRIADVRDDDEVDAEELGVPPDLMEKAKELRHLAASLPDEDPKRDRLVEVLSQIMAEDGPGKVLVFSFYLHTLDYLYKALSRAGLRVGLITGQVQDEEEREALRNRFRLARTEPNAIDVLLSSEVGCEGLDYEFCNCLVNYDIPWNPMRIEQRIGRIDRFGQLSDKVRILNFVTPGTVEERVFHRCFDRLGVFRDTLGDLEAVLGDLVQDMTQVALDPTLSPEQAEEKARQIADNALRLREEERRMEDESAGLLGMEEAFVAEVNQLIEEGRFVSPDELRQMIEVFLAQPEFGGAMSDVSGQPGVLRLRLKKSGRQELLREVTKLQGVDRSAAAFRRWLGCGERHMLLTFDQETAARQRDLAFVTPLHPLARIAVRYWASRDVPLASRFEVVDSRVPEGFYLFVCDLWETVSVSTEVRIICSAWGLTQDREAPGISAQLLNLLAKASGARAAEMPIRSLLDAALAKLDEYEHRQRQAALADLRERNGRLVDRKLASLEAYWQHRRGKVEAELAQASHERITEMKQRELENIEREYSARRSEIECRRDADIVSQRLAAGLLQVSHCR